MNPGGRSSWARALLFDLVVPLGMAAAAAAAAAALVAPHWTARGAPWFLGYPKNVEHASVAAAVAAAVAGRWLVTWRAGRRLAGLVTVIGVGVLLRFVDPGVVGAGWPQLVLMMALPMLLGALWPRPDRDTAAPPARDAPAWFALAAAGGLAAVAFLLATDPLTIDVFHDGEVLASAVDLLQGGQPFKTFIWPHGLHDTGLAALWILITGKIGTSPVALARASCAALGVVATYGLARRLLGSRVEALAACVVPALAPAFLADDARRAAAAFAVHQLGVLAFVVAAFALLTGRRRWREPAAGVALGLAYLFRFEAGVYGVTAAIAVLAARALADAPAAPARAMLRFGLAVGGLGLGTVATLAGVALVTGWPGADWLSYTLVELPRYHRDAVGVPFPWPIRDWAVPSPATPEVLIAWLVFAVLLVVQAVRATVVERATGAPSHARAAQLVFLAVFAVLATRSSLERSDTWHVVQWISLPLVGCLLLAVALARDRLGWSRARAALATVLALGLVHFGTLEAEGPRLRGPRTIVADALRRGHQLREHLAPNAPAGACGDTTFTAAEAVVNDRFIADTCAVEHLLRAHGVTELAIQHSAPWYYVRFGLRPATRFFALARAYTPAREEQLIGELRARGVQALLRVHGYGALPAFDVPDTVRVPVVSAWLRERNDGAARTRTPLGELVFWNEAVPAPRRPAPADGAPVTFFTDFAIYDPTAAQLLAGGWAAVGSAPLHGLACTDAAVPGAHVEYGLPRDDVAEALKTPTAAATGWELQAPLTPAAWDALRRRSTIALEAVTADDRAARRDVDLSAARALPPLDGAAGDALPAALARAAALGRADRAAGRERAPIRPSGAAPPS